jgi:LPXTG-motif cell wall-anchored protein
MPKNIANYLVTETEEAQEASQLVIGQINPYYTSEIMYMLIGIASLGISGFVLYRRRREFRGIIASLFFAITGAVFIIDLF